MKAGKGRIDGNNMPERARALCLCPHLDEAMRRSFSFMRPLKTDKCAGWGT